MCPERDFNSIVAGTWKGQGLRLWPDGGSVVVHWMRLRKWTTWTCGLDCCRQANCRLDNRDLKSSDLLSFPIAVQFMKSFEGAVNLNGYGAGVGWAKPAAIILHGGEVVTGYLQAWAFQKSSACRLTAIKGPCVKRGRLFLCGGFAFSCGIST